MTDREKVILISKYCSFSEYGLNCRLNDLNRSFLHSSDTDPYNVLKLFMAQIELNITKIIIKDIERILFEFS